MLPLNGQYLHSVMIVTYIQIFKKDKPRNKSALSKKKVLLDLILSSEDSHVL